MAGWRFARDVLVNVIANLIAAGIVYVFGALVGWFPSDRVPVVTLVVAALAFVVVGGLVGGNRPIGSVRERIGAAIVGSGLTIAAGYPGWLLIRADGVGLLPRTAGLVVCAPFVFVGVGQTSLAAVEAIRSLRGAEPKEGPGP